MDEKPPHSVLQLLCTGRILDSELEMRLEEENPQPGPTNAHSGVVGSVNNSFSWLSLARYQENTLNKHNNRNKFFQRPNLKHERTILDI